MNWFDKYTWKKCFISTFICLLACSIGAMSTAIYLMNYDWWFVLSISIIVGFISCMIFMVIWEMAVHKMNFNDSVKHSFKMSIVSILIMILTENFILLYVFPKFSFTPMVMTGGHGFKMILFTMSFGFLLSLPYNYYYLQKTGKICH